MTYILPPTLKKVVEVKFKDISMVLSEIGGFVTILMLVGLVFKPLLTRAFRGELAELVS